MAEGKAQRDRAGSEGSRIAVIDKAVSVLDALLPIAGGLTPTEVATIIETNRSTAFRLLTSLEHAGLLNRDAESGRYRLGVKLLRYGGAVRASMSIIKIAEPVLLDLRDETRQTTLLAMREGWGARCLLRLPGPEVDVRSWASGEWLPLHVGAATQALMSAMSDDEVDRYLTENENWRTARGERGPDDIRATVSETRERDWALDEADATPGIASLGTIIDTSPGTPEYAISVAGLAYHYSGMDLDRTVAKVRAAAADISQRLRD